MIPGKFLVGATIGEICCTMELFGRLFGGLRS